MESIPARTQSTQSTQRRWGIVDAAIGTIAAVAMVWFAGWVINGSVPLSWAGAVMLSYLAAWVPLLGTVLIATCLRGRRSLPRDFGLRFTWLDILFGLTLGFFLRSIASWIEIIGYGHPAGRGITFAPMAYDLWWVFLAILAPIVIGPLIEELFFRGLLQRAVFNSHNRSTPQSSRTSTTIAVSVSSLIFATLHIIQISDGQQMMVVGLSTLVLGLGLGTLTAVTGRLGGAIVAHAVFNGLGVLSTLL